MFFKISDGFAKKKNDNRAATLQTSSSLPYGEPQPS
jgi:hypothetical protein